MIIISRDHKPFIFILIIALVLDTNCTAIDQSTITSTQNITDPQSLTSPEGVFKLGFFSPGNSTYRYVGIWFNKVLKPTVVWVANRETPIKDSSFGVLKIAEDGNLVVLDAQGLVHWTTNVSNIPFNNSIVELLDDGKLVLRQVSDRKILWESFEHPTDTFLPTMKLGGNRKTGKKLRLTSWKSESDPSPGTFFSELELNVIPQVVIWNGSTPHWRSGPWNSKRFIGIPNMDAAFLDGFYMIRDPQMEDDIYLTFKYSDNSSLVRIVLSNSGVLFGDIWDGRNGWKRFWSSKDYGDCDVYGVCGPYGRCSMSERPICSCLRGFIPKYPDEWYKGNWSSGCVRKTALKCEKNSSDQDGFLKMGNMKVPDFANWVASPSNDKDCEQKCLKNCSCLAYWYDQDVGCMTWSGNLIDTEKFSTDGGVDLQIRVAHSELEFLVKNSTKKKVIIAITVTVIGVLIFTGTYSYYKAVKAKQRGLPDKDMELLLSTMHNTDSETCNRTNGSDLEIFKFEKIMMATNNFCEDNKLGEGGFGSVYKGKITNGQEIAVKRLSTGSRQGVVEFKNEVQVIVKLQHRNLVRLLGCCIEGEEKMLIYEYLPNKSLDAFLFDSKKRVLLDWECRFKIIEGICRGILYLHRDSRLRVIHRDLKASNILLDEEFNPKISDFGMARIFKSDDDELQANTKRIVGTYGYMSPEYAMKGQFSEKSDVFSFGVLLLEIISGKRNSSFYHQEQPASLSEYAWQLWKEKRSQSLIDTTLSLSEEIYEVEILRCIHVGLLCVQEYVNDRPNMSTILSMLTSEIATLPTPKQPPFTERVADSNSNPSPTNHTAFTINDVTITELEGR